MRVPAPTTNTTVLDLGMWLFVSLNASNVTGGSGNPANYQYQWFGLPSNCTTKNVANYSCVPTSTGAFSISVRVNDTGVMRNATSSAVSVTVNTDPRITSFTVSAASVAVNGSITFTATASGGTVPTHGFVYNYKGLPSGCTGNTSTITCSPRVAQGYNVSVFVVDAVGMSSNSPSVSVTVTSGAAPSASKGPTAAEWGIIAAILVIGFAIAAVLWMRARKEERTSYAAAPPPPTPPPSNPPPTPPSS